MLGLRFNGTNLLVGSACGVPSLADDGVDVVGEVENVALEVHERESAGECTDGGGHCVGFCERTALALYAR
jgi:hypothetical protein